MKTVLIFLSFFFIFIFHSCSVKTEKNFKNDNKKTTHTKNDIRNGYYESHYDNGQLWSTSEYKHGKRHGKTTSYYPNGKLRYMGFYKDNKKSGQWFFYREDGSFEKEINYESHP